MITGGESPQDGVVPVRVDGRPTTYLNGETQ